MNSISRNVKTLGKLKLLCLMQHKTLPGGKVEASLSYVTQASTVAVKELDAAVVMAVKEMLLLLNLVVNDSRR